VFETTSAPAAANEASISRATEASSAEKSNGQSSGGALGSSSMAAMRDGIGVLCTQRVASA
jgi:hypothetical protein